MTRPPLHRGGQWDPDTSHDLPRRGEMGVDLDLMTFAETPGFRKLGGAPIRTSGTSEGLLGPQLHSWRAAGQRALVGERSGRVAVLTARLRCRPVPSGAVCPVPRSWTPAPARSAGQWSPVRRCPVGHTDPGYMSRKSEKFRTDKFDT